MSQADFDREVELAVGVVLQSAHKKLEALKEAISPTPPTQMTAAEGWAVLAAQSHRMMTDIGTALERLGVALTVELFGSAQQKEVLRKLMKGGSRG
jgi:hypothetical protein